MKHPKISWFGFSFHLLQTTFTLPILAIILHSYFSLSDIIGIWLFSDYFDPSQSVNQSISKCLQKHITQSVNVFNNHLNRTLYKKPK